MSYLTIEQIEQANDLKESDIDVPNWGGKLHIRELTRQQQIEIENKSRDEDGNIDIHKMQMLIMIHCVVEPKLEEKHIPILNQKNFNVIDEILKELDRLAYVREEEIAAARKTFRDETGSVAGIVDSEQNGIDTVTDSQTAD